MKIPIYQIDAFADKPFSGNPAAVCPLDKWIPDDIMQAIAAEMNLSETAFFVPRRGEAGVYDLRWFTPLVEVDLCGHATLASGYVILNHLNPDLNQVIFHTRSGELRVEPRDEMLELVFPANSPVVVTDVDEIDAVGAALGTTPVVVLHANTTVAVFASESDVADLKPDFAAVSNLQQPWLVATAPADDEQYDFVSRFFVPTTGINEDPVTGSTHTILMPYWSNRFGRNKLVGRQISTRGGTLYCELVGDRVKIAGDVVEVMLGELSVEL
ncbi:MAG: PhzF family phenazine biosynthesis protein [Dehalococcoidia bacterium]